MSDYSKLKDSKDIGTKGKRRKNNQPNTTSELEQNAIMVAQKECLKIFLSFFDSNIHTFFPDHKIDEDFVNLFIKTGFDMLENPNNIKNQEIKQSLFDMMQMCMEKYGSEIKYMLN